MGCYTLCVLLFRAVMQSSSAGTNSVVWLSAASLGWGRAPQWGVRRAARQQWESGGGMNRRGGGRLQQSEALVWHVNMWEEAKLQVHLALFSL